MPITTRFLIGLVGLAGFWAGGMVSANEFAKSAVLLAGCIYGIAGCIAAWSGSLAWLDRIARLCWLLFFLDAAVKGFLRSYFGMRPNPGMVLQAVFNTHLDETVEFLSQQWRGLAFSAASLLAAMLVALWLSGRLRRRDPAVLPRRRPARIGASVMLALLVAIHFNPTMAKENPLLFWPLRYLDHVQQLQAMAQLRGQIASSRAQPHEWMVRYHGEAQRTVLWVIGESTNRNNMSLYGYQRATTPRLNAMRDELLVFEDVISSNSATVDSLIKMLTPASLAKPNEWVRKPDILQLAEAAGYKRFWLSNQAANDGWLGLVAEEADTLRYINYGNGRGENNIDGNLLPYIDAALADPAPKKFIVVHLLGAHPTYDMRYPDDFARFNGLDDSVAVGMKASGRSFWIRQQRDEYDNAILYGDYVLSEILRRVRTSCAGKPATLLFNADHGQEVGHFRDHAGQSPVDTSGYEIPVLLWKNAAARDGGEQDPAALQQRPYQTDRMEHTVLGLLKVTSAYYQPEHDLLSPQFRPAPRLIGGLPYQPPPRCPQPPAAATSLATAPAVRSLR